MNDDYDDEISSIGDGTYDVYMHDDNVGYRRIGSLRVEGPRVTVASDPGGHLRPIVDFFIGYDGRLAIMSLDGNPYFNVRKVA